MADDAKTPVTVVQALRVLGLDPSGLTQIGVRPRLIIKMAARHGAVRQSVRNLWSLRRVLTAKFIRDGSSSRSLLTTEQSTRVSPLFTSHPLEKELPWHFAS